MYWHVKKHIDEWDVMQIGIYGDGEYELESAEIVKAITSDTNALELSNIIISVFTDYFGDVIQHKKENVYDVANKILESVRAEAFESSQTR